jgi:hypothetical protein
VFDFYMDKKEVDLADDDVLEVISQTSSLFLGSRTPKALRYSHALLSLSYVIK